MALQRVYTDDSAPDRALEIWEEDATDVDQVVVTVHGPQGQGTIDGTRERVVETLWKLVTTLEGSAPDPVLTHRCSRCGTTMSSLGPCPNYACPAPLWDVRQAVAGEFLATLKRMLWPPTGIAAAERAVDRVLLGAKTEV